MVEGAFDDQRLECLVQVGGRVLEQTIELNFDGFERRGPGCRAERNLRLCRKPQVLR
jgi:hypothetical protein